MLEHKLVKEFWRKSSSDHQRLEAENAEEMDNLRRELVKLRSSHSKLEKENRSLMQRLALLDRPAAPSSGR